MTQILAVGEVMVELAPAGETGGKKLMALGYAGDTYNTSIYLSRLGIRTAYFTRLGDDPYSAEVIQHMENEGLDTESVERVPGRTPGLYLIANQPNGERSFTFWRGQSPAREMFASDASVSAFEQGLKTVQRVYFSGVTLGILGDAARVWFFSALRAFRAGGGAVIFDNNYRPQLWRDREQAQAAMAEALRVADMALLTDDDETRLWDSGEESDILSRCQSAGVLEVAIKRGPRPVILASRRGAGDFTETCSVPVPPVPNLVDTTAAGDSFNAGYLSARLSGSGPASAAAFGSRCARVVIQHRGAIVPRDLFLAEMHLGNMGGPSA